MGKYCSKCNDFEERIKYIDGAIGLAYTHGLWDPPEGITFKYCPYCGSELKDK